ncbi:MAG: type I secretion system permease/ATPase [Proteobacteria bacterium]|nr:type I secretion system permease/ATPase [Pseudomonadota bacterium]
MTQQQERKRAPKKVAQTEVAKAHVIFDVLLECLVYLAGYYQKQFSRPSLVAGLPLRSGRLTPSLFVRAARRIGLNAKVVDRAPDHLSPHVVPFVALTKNGGAVVVTALDEKKSLTYYDPSTNQSVASVPLDAFVEQVYEGSVILLRPASAAELATDMFQTGQGWFWSTVKQFRKLYGQVILASVFTNLMAIVSPIFVMNVYDRVVPNAATATLWALASAVILCFVFDFIFRQLRGYFIDVAGRGADILLASRLFQHVLNIRLGKQANSAGSFANQLREFESLRDFFTSATLVSLIDLPFVFIFIGFVALFGGAMALVPLIAVPLVLMLSLTIQRPIKSIVARVTHELDAKHGHLVEALTGIEAIKAHNLESRTQAIWEQSVGTVARVSMASRFYAAFGLNFSIFIQQIVSVLVVIIGVYRIKEGDLSVGGLVACTLLTGRAMAPVSQAAALYARYEQANTSLKTLGDIMAMETERPEGKQFIYNPAFAGGITFRNVYFSYPGAQNNSLHNLNMRIRPGEKVGIIGRTGSGKSTIAKLILNLYNPQSGSILLDDIEIRQQDPSEFRSKMGYVPQTVSLFNTTLRENIMMAYPQASPEEFNNAAELSCVSDFAGRHPMGYDMPLGRGGDGISGGQKQCVALARMFLKNHKVVIMDEPTNGLDSRTEQTVLNNMRHMFKSSTLIVITHRPALLDLVDRVIVVDNGHIVADGPKEKVLHMLANQGIQANTGGNQ